MVRKKKEFTLSEETNEYLETLPDRTRSKIVDEAISLFRQKQLNIKEPPKEKLTELENVNIVL